MAKSSSSSTQHGTPTLPASSFLAKTDCSPSRKLSRPPSTSASSLMPCLSGRFDPGIGPIINVGVLQPGTMSPPTMAAAKIVTFPALIAPGASVTSPPPPAPKPLGLQPMGMRPMLSATHSVPVNVYLVDLVLPFGAAGFLTPCAQEMEIATAAG